jgi:hypothetical protein
MPEKRKYTEIRIYHKDMSEKKEYESRLCAAIRKLGFKHLTEWLRQMVREAIERAEKK